MDQDTIRRLADLERRLAKAEALETPMMTEGSTFPASVYTGQRHWHTTRKIEYYYDGTRWLTTQEYSIAWGEIRALIPISATGQPIDAGLDGDYQIYLTRAVMHVYLNTTATPSVNYWTLSLSSILDGATATITSHWSFDTKTLTQTQRIKCLPTAPATNPLNVVLNASTGVLYIDATKTGAPGTIYIAPEVKYRLIG